MPLVGGIAKVSAACTCLYRDGDGNEHNNGEAFGKLWI